MEKIGGGDVNDLPKYCVTGASGYIGSYLVRSLLDKGYSVHATVRDPSKCAHLLKLHPGSHRLRLFRADLMEEGSFDQAVNGCQGVYHVAAFMEFSVQTEDGNVNSYVQSKIIEPSIKGTINLLKSCLKTNSIKRVIFTSSISTMTAKDSIGQWTSLVDESCQVPTQQVWNTKASGWVYVLAKRLTEEAAFQFAKENAIDLVSVITTTVAGPFLTPTIPTSIRVLLSPLTGDPELFPILYAVNSRMGSIALVHIQDICNAHIFLMEHPLANGQYICCAQSCAMTELVLNLAHEYPFCSNLQRLVTEEQGSIPVEISSKKLRDLGFTYKYGMKEIIQQTIDDAISHGFLHPRGST